MAKELLFQFGSGSDKSLSIFGNDTKLINLYINKTPNARSEYELRSLEGSDIVSTVIPENGVGCRGLFKSSIGPISNGSKPQVYGVFGDGLYRFNSYNLGIFIGKVKNSSEFVTFAESQEQGTTNVKGFVCDGTLIYEWELTSSDAAVSSTFAEIAYIPYVNGSSVEKAIPANITYYNYRLIMSCKNSNQWFYSGINDSVFDDGKWYTTEFKNDKTVKVISNGGSIWSFANSSVEIWSRTGEARDPFSSPLGNQHNIGLASVQGTAQLDSDIYWIGNGDTATAGIFKGSGSGSITRISTPGIENIISNWKYRSQVKAFAYRINGNSFIVFTSILDNETYAYNVENNSWSQRSSSNNGFLNYWDIVYATIGEDGTMYCGTAQTNNLCKFNNNTCVDHNGYSITREYSSPVFISGLYKFIMREIALDVECGVGSSYTTQPYVFIQCSPNGKVFGERRLYGLGFKGQYQNRVRGVGFGIGRNFIIKFGTSEPLPITFYQMRLKIEECGGL